MAVAWLAPLEAALMVAPMGAAWRGVAICAFCCAVKSGNSPWLALGTAGTGAGAAGALESWVRSITGRWLCSGKASKSWDQMDGECVTWIYMYMYIYNI